MRLPRALAAAAAVLAAAAALFGGPSSALAFQTTAPVEQTRGNIGLAACAQWSILGRVTSGSGALSCEAPSGTGSILRATSPTIVTPTIASFTNATHNHLDAAGGGTLSGYVKYSTAACNDSTNDVTTIQGEIDAANTAGTGTVILPPGRCIIGSPGLTMKSTVRLEGFGSTILKSKSDIGDEIIDATTANNWTINGIRFDLDGVAFGAIDIAGINWQFTNNTVTGAPTSSQSEWNLVKLGCSTGSWGQCLIQGNRITGSETDATNDNCLNLTGGSAGFTGQGYLIVDNDISGCGEDGIVGSVTGVQIANNNVDNIVGGIGINIEGDVTVNGSILGNQIGVDGGSDACIQVRGDNTEIAGNHCGANADEWAIIIIAGAESVASNTAGVKVSDNYAADGIWFKSLSKCSGGAQGDCYVSGDCTGASSGVCTSTDYGRFDHNLILGNVTARPGTAGDDLLLENQMNLTVGDNTILGSKGTAAMAGIKFVTTRSDVSSGDVVVGHNTIGIYDASSGGQSSCIIFDDSGGGGFDEFVVDGNTCGRQQYPASTGPASEFVKALNSPAPWTDMSFTDNNAAQTAAFITNDPGSTKFCGNVGKADTCGILGSGADHVAVLTTDGGQSITTTTLAGVTGLSTTVTAGQTYSVDLVMVLDDTSGADDWKWRIDCAACSGTNESSFWYMCEDLTGGTNVGGNFTLNSTTSITVASGTRDYYCHVFGNLETGSPGGTLAFQVALNANSGGAMKVGEGTKWTVQTPR